MLNDSSQNNFRVSNLHWNVEAELDQSLLRNSQLLAFQSLLYQVLKSQEVSVTLNSQRESMQRMNLREHCATIAHVSFDIIVEFFLF